MFTLPYPDMKNNNSNACNFVNPDLTKDISELRSMTSRKL